MVTTKKQIAAADVGWHPDSRCQGLALWVKSGGRKVWVLDYRHNGRQRRMTLGRADTLPADDALKLARKHRVDIDHGRDPLAEKEAARRADAANVTLTTFFVRYIDEYATLKKKPRSIADDRWMFETNIKQPLGRTHVPDVTHHDVARLHRQLTARPAPILANRAVALLSTVMNLAERWGVRPVNSNPCKFVEKNPEKKTHRFLTSEQLIALGRVLAESERCTDPTADAYELPIMLAAVRVLLFTGCRKSEVLTLKWADVNLEAGVLDLPDSKSGRKLVTLNAPARQLLSGLPRTSDYVFPGRRIGKPVIGLGHVWERLRTRAGLEGVRLHDLRHSYASTAAGLGASLPVIGALLGHSVPATTARYAGLADDPRRVAAEAVGKQLAALLSPPKQPAAVVPMRRKRGRRG
jgi:integrase